MRVNPIITILAALSTAFVGTAWSVRDLASAVALLCGVVIGGFFVMMAWLIYEARRRIEAGELES